MLKKIKSLKLRVLIQTIIIFIVGILLECFLGNYKHFLMMPDPQKDFAINEVATTGLRLSDDKTYYETTSSSPQIEISNVDMQIKTIFFDLTNLDEEVAVTKVKVEYTDETRPEYTWFSRNIEVVQGYENSKYLQEDFFGKTEKIRLTLDVKYGDKLQINGISFNKAIPFYFSGVRISAFFVLTYGVYFFVMAFKYKDVLKEKPKFNLAIKITAVGLSMGLILLIFGEIYNGFANYFFQTNGSQISKELVDAFLNGQVSLLEKPSDELLALENPYVWANRDGIHYLWDHLLYNGKYYSYYGITPVFLLFLPFKLITGYYFYDGYGVLLFSLIATLFLGLAYFKLLKNYFNDVPLALSIGGFGILFMSCGILTNIPRPYFYEVSTSCANMCMMISLFHLAYSGILAKDGKIKPYHVLFHTFWASLAVLSRATFALYAICSVILIIFAYVEKRKDFNPKSTALYWCFALIPYVLFGSIQMAYNYVRFGNIFEFGIQYSLTINDFRNTEFHFNLAWTSIWNFLFAFPKITDINYFVIGQTLTFGQSGYYFFETRDAIGLFNRVPLLYSIFILPFLPSKKTFKKRLIYTVKYVLPCIIVPFILVFITWESGFATRYYSDFAWAMVLFIVFTFIKFYKNAEASDNKTAMNVFAILIGSTIFFSFVGGMALINGYIPVYGKHIGAKDYAFGHKWYRKARELSFWL